MTPADGGATASGAARSDKFPSRRQHFASKHGLRLSVITGAEGLSDFSCSPTVARARPAGQASLRHQLARPIYPRDRSWWQRLASILVPVPYRGRPNAGDDVMWGGWTVARPATLGLPRVDNGSSGAAGPSDPAIRCCPTRRRRRRHCRACIHVWLGMATAPRTPRPIVRSPQRRLHRALSLPPDIIRQCLKEAAQVSPLRHTTPSRCARRSPGRDRHWKQDDRAHTSRGQ